MQTLQVVKANVVSKRIYVRTQSALRHNKEVALQCCCADSESEKQQSILLKY